MRTASRPNILEDPKQLRELFQTVGWQTLMTFTRESARKPPLIYHRLPTLMSATTAARTKGPAPSSIGFGPDSDIPQEVFDQIAAEEAASQAAGAPSPGVKVCPHCTFANPPGRSDCEVCGLPLG